MKSLKEILDEARMIATGDFKISSSGRKVRRLIKIGDDDYNKADDVDKDGDVDADDRKMKKMRGESVEQIDEISSGLATSYKDKATSSMNRAQGAADTHARHYANNHKDSSLASHQKFAAKVDKRKAGIAAADKRIKEEAEQIEEAVSVKKQDYSWGKMVTVHHGADTSYPLHPEHQAAIKKLKDGEHTSFTDETNRKVTAHREGEHVHLSSKGSSRKTTVAHSHFNESLDYDKIRADAADHLKKSIDKQSDDRIAALKNPKKPESFLSRVGRKQINMVKGAWHGLTKESTDKDEDDVPFDKPYKKVQNDVVTDKSGAKHGPMSRARNLARIAAAQQQKKATK